MPPISMATLLAALPEGFALKPVTERRYWDALEVLPPVAQLSCGFLVGEPVDHRVCGLNRDTRPTFTPFVEGRGRASWYEGSHALTTAEWRALAARHDALDECIRRGAR